MEDDNMALNTEELYSKAVELSKDFDDNFLDLAKTLRQLLDKDPEAFRDVWTKTNLGRRKAYYLVEVSRAFDGITMSRARLKKIGWTKLQVLSKHVSKDNVAEMLELAEKHSTKELESLMRGEKPESNAHCLLMYFSPQQFEVVERALLKYGGTRAGRGINDKEDALVKALETLETLQG